MNREQIKMALMTAKTYLELYKTSSNDLYLRELKNTIDMLKREKKRRNEVNLNIKEYFLWT